MRYLSLFSGLDAATVAWAPLGWKCAGVAEIEPYCCNLLEQLYPNVPNLGDVSTMTEADVAALGPLDLLVFGSPCQDLSLAVKRKGLNGERSGLFFVAMRIAEWARRHCGLRWALWENVPGVFSSAGGNDFAAVVKHMVGLECDTQKPDGQQKVAWSDRKAYSNGRLSMRNGSEWRNGAVACSLWQVFETGQVDHQNSLSRGS